MSIALAHLYTGDGKGKTTAAMGLAVRARGCGMRVRVMQFMKQQPTGEQRQLESLGVEFERAFSDCDKFVWDMNDVERAEYTQAQRELFERARTECASGSAQMLILDEALSATYLGAFSQTELCELVRSRRPGLEIVLTGRGAGDELIAVCDYVTEMRMLRHPMDQGIAARRGIEY